MKELFQQTPPVCKLEYYGRNLRDLGLVSATLVPVTLSNNREFLVLPANNRMGFDEAASKIYLLTTDQEGIEYFNQITGPRDFTDKVFSAYLEQVSKRGVPRNNPS